MFSFSLGVLDASLVNSVSQMFTFYRVYNETTCSSDKTPPSPVDPIPDFNISYCSIWVYNLPSTLFHDVEVGETIAIKLSLLNQNGKFCFQD